MILALLRGLVVACIGTGVLVSLMRMFPPLIGRHWEVESAFIGAFLSTVCFGRGMLHGVRRNLVPATRIVVATLLVVSAVYAVAQVVKLNKALDYEASGLLFWELVATSWWLIPGAAIVLASFNAVLQKMGAGSQHEGYRSSIV